MNGYADLPLLLTTSFVIGLAIGWWARCALASIDDDHVARIREIVREHTAPDPENARRARLAYDTVYDERHPEEWV